MMFYYLLVVMYVLVCLLLLASILLQQGRAGDIASAFGGSSSQTVFGARTGATMLTRATTVLAVLFMLGSIGLAIAWQKGPSSVVSGVKTPAAPTTPAVPPAAPAKK
jgi:preprotein translocase subunit SecG